jgi:hypothetical protein
MPAIRSADKVWAYIGASMLLILGFLMVAGVI